MIMKYVSLSMNEGTHAHLEKTCCPTWNNLI